ncbi:MAG: hypothetical protein JWP08_2200 [Bryobacterales bacterium]|nr:hypothetical protein [Bryobacterales bacterium]
MPAVENPTDLFSFADLLNQTLRRLKQYGTESEWVAALLDGVSHFAAGAALFAVEEGQLRLRGARKLSLPDGFAIPVTLGRAFETATNTKDPVVALRTPSEVTPHLSSTDMIERAVVIPIPNGARVAALLFAVTKWGGHSPVLELLSGMASLVLERQANSSLAVQISSASPAPATKQPAPPYGLPVWSRLGEEQRRLHIRAQRFSRVKVAEMQLFRPDACRAGRKQSNVYLFLKKEIDAARESYRDQFMAQPGMDDYLHLELVRIAADGDEKNLGVDYPGHLG